jgi:hypothetical protein
MNANSKKIAGIAATTILLALPATVAQADCAHALRGWTANQNNVSQTAGPTLYGPAEPMIDKNKSKNKKNSNIKEENTRD